MVTRICTLLILFSISFSYGQDVTLLKNFNPKAKELKHNLNHNRDSLLLKSENKILKVDIFNEDYDQTSEIKDFKTSLSLKDLPVGKFVIEVQLTDKIVLMHVIKHDYFNAINKTSLAKNNDIAEGKGMMLDDELKVIKNPPSNSIEFLLTGVKPKRNTPKKEKFFWVIKQTNNESGASKTMKLVNKESVDRMISKNSMERNSSSGQSNEITVWEVYDTSKFMEQQMSNPNFINSSKSDYFNTSPYYSSLNNTESL